MAHKIAHPLLNIDVAISLTYMLYDGQGAIWGLSALVVNIDDAKGL